MTRSQKPSTLTHMRLATLCLLALSLLPANARAQVPVFQTAPVDSSVKFYVKASVALVGNFDKWDARLTFASREVTSGVLDIKIQAATVSTGSGIKDKKLKGKDFFDVDQNPLITFHSTKVVQTGPETLDVIGDFTIRGVSKPETLKMTISGKGTGKGTIKGTMAFDRKDYGINGSIPFVKIADRVEVNVDLKVNQTSGPRLTYQQ
ncbi:YceI family protein [Granulicella sp. S190]|uniref:YceI family protein n=1 Tax=Granulicella sp. S190 TaxID=1747226 RepID=UPI00131A7A04|nr:YceI family protein [Granulicella sp. S190]